ncbi:fumarylacetoacetate hydrolase family protein [Dactylosporangium sp. AC04546]|uniref:fumarylacetoacetate hydrolase family protein n=1 Tax=Dactylosporangium sp. AC04546 TaxID=2862460 RepID=UPI001EDE5941|nr:fumarylacetoacetate hydrolase family protein [Dactylosporangium sp. AC04546]WVK80839.1 fumarylacetoacetate hydrolase family protein [Dactylosporangium sp. AC04546]
MRFGVFGDDRLAVVAGEDAIDVTDLLELGPVGPQGPLQRLLERRYEPAELASERLASLRRWPIAELNWRAPLPRPGKIMGAPANYVEHVDEMPDAHTILDWGMFMKASSSVTGPDTDVRLPYLDKRTDQEGELGVVIGRTARDVPIDEALGYVFGYTCVLDITVRSTEDRSTRKSFDTFTPLGPWVTTADEVGDPADLRLRCWVNDELRQDAATKTMIFGVPELVAYASSVMTLWPGDVIATGTPAGVGPLRHGDTVAVEIERVGRLQVGVSSVGAIAYADRPGHGGKR